jgi:hypothetical protein
MSETSHLAEQLKKLGAVGIRTRPGKQ